MGRILVNTSHIFKTELGRCWSHSTTIIRRKRLIIAIQKELNSLISLITESWSNAKKIKSLVSSMKMIKTVVMLGLMTKCSRKLGTSCELHVLIDFYQCILNIFTYSAFAEYFQLTLFRLYKYVVFFIWWKIIRIL